MVYSQKQIDVPNDPELTRTPFVQQKEGGNWVLFFIQGKIIEWGHRFDPETGYRVYVKFENSNVLNCFFADQARKAARLMLNDRIPSEDVLALAKTMKILADDVDSLNKAWALAGCPDTALIYDMAEEGAGHA